MRRLLGMTTRDMVLVVSYATALLLLVVNAYLVEETRSSQFRYNMLTDRSSEVIRTLERATTSLALAESAVRGFVLTGEQSFETQFEDHLSEVRTLLRSIQQYDLVAGEESLLVRTIGSMEERAELLRRTLFLRNISLGDAQALLQSGEPTLAMQRYLADADSLGSLLNARLEAEATGEDQQVVFLLLLSRGGSVLAILIIVLALVSTVRYLKDRNYHEHLLKVSEERFRLAVENSPVIQFVAEPGGSITMIEGTGLQMFGADPDALTGRPLSDLLGKSTVVEGAFKRALHGETVVEELVLGGSAVEVMLAPYRRESGAISGVTGLWRDISERKRAEEALDSVRRELERSNNDLQQFAYVASHDLQAPLRATREYVSLLEQEEGGKLSPASMEYLGYMRSGIERMVSLIRDLLEFSRVGSAPPVLDWIDLSAIVQETVKEVDAVLKEKNGHIDIGPLPVVQGNEGQVRQVFRNLIGNALKFVQGRPPAISIDATEDDHGWVVTVADNGIGIREQDQERIFKIFQRVQTSDDVEGNGFGLAITKRIIEKHGGRIWVTSKLGEGTKFSCSFPRPL